MPHPILVLLIAPFIGSFLGVLIIRLPRGDDVVATRSHCDHCHHTLGPIELLPVLGALLLRGRCRHCHRKIDPFHWRVELAALAVAIAAVLATPDPTDPATLWATCVLGWALLALTWIDLRHFLLPDVLTLPLLLAGLTFTAWSQPDAIADRAAAALAGWAALAGLAALYRAWRGIDGLGGGDAKLLAAAGAWLGLAALPWLVAIAATLTLLAALVLHRTRRAIGRATPLPFGPGLAAAFWLLHLALTAGLIGD